MAPITNLSNQIWHLSICFIPDFLETVFMKVYKKRQTAAPQHFLNYMHFYKDMLQEVQEKKDTLKYMIYLDRFVMGAIYVITYRI